VLTQLRASRRARGSNGPKLIVKQDPLPVTRKVFPMKALSSPGRLFLGPVGSSELADLISDMSQGGRTVFIVDDFFRSNADLLYRLKAPLETTFFTPAGSEPGTDYLDSLARLVRQKVPNVSGIVGVGGGIAMDTAKALSVLLPQRQSAAELQGWDIPTVKAIPKIGIPTVFGTGAESSRTAVLTNHSTGLKLGINSDHSQFDAVWIDSSLQATLPRRTLVVTATDAYFHSFEILTGKFRNPASDSLASQALALISDALWSADPYEPEHLQNIALSSFFAGLALTGGIVGLVHPLSAAIGVTYGIGHTEANVRALRGLSFFYQEQAEAIERLLSMHNMVLDPLGISPKDDDGILILREQMLTHAKPLTNALGPDFEDELSIEKMSEIVVRL